MNLNPKVIFATAGAAIGAALSAVVPAVLAQCGGSASLVHTVSSIVLPILGAAVGGYMKSQGSWTPTAK